MHFIQQNGLRQYTEETKIPSYAINGTEYDRCPFCGTDVPSYATVCTGCGARKAGGFTEWYERNKAIYLFCVVVIPVVAAIIMFAIILSPH